jgi:hypothetical protein
MNFADQSKPALRMDTVITRQFIRQWLGACVVLPAPFTFADYLAVQRSALM